MAVSTEVYLDLDDTALDTAAFKQYLAEGLVKYGVSHESFFAAYRQVRQAGSFSIAKLVDQLGISSAQHEVVAAVLATRASECGRFLHTDILPFAAEARRRKVKLVLFTYGDRVVQELKLSGLRALTDAVAEVHITEDDGKVLPDPKDGVRAVIIDNRSEVLERYVDDARVTPILVVRDGVECQPSRLRAYSSLKKVAEMLSKEGLW